MSTITTRKNNTTMYATLLGIGCATVVGYFLYNELGRQKYSENKLIQPPNAVENKNRTKPRRSLSLKKDCIIEVCLSDIRSLRNAIAGGCNSVELCCNRVEGGVTPSIGLIEQCVTVIGGRDIALHVLIRPRPGGFMYSDDEFDIIQRDILAAKLAGADGIVFGALDRNGNIDQARMKLIRELSKGMILTFHRAFDVCNQTLTEALEIIIALGCDRLLTSAGPNANVTQNLSNLRNLHSLSKDRIEIVAAAGINEHNVTQILYETRIKAIHAGNSVCQLTSELTLSKEIGSEEGVLPTQITEFGTESYVDVRLDQQRAGGIQTESLKVTTSGLSHNTTDKPTTTSSSTSMFAALTRGATTTTQPSTTTNATTSAVGIQGTNTAVSSSTSGSSVEELRYWQCVSEDAVCRLVVAARTARADCMVQSPTTATNASGTTTAGTDGYIHL